jgi:Zn-dependent protease
VEFLQQAVMVLVPMILSLTVHEYAHARSAFALGDDTAARMGRMNLNPLSHIDPLGTVLLPLLAIGTGAPFFGWARPVPVNPVMFTRRVRMKTGLLLTAAAGPASNVLFALVVAAAYRGLLAAGVVHIPFLMALGAGRSGALGGGGEAAVATLLGFTFLVNVGLAVFNLLPVPPLDGSRVLLGLLPDSLGRHFEVLQRNPVFVLLGFAALIFFAGRILAWPVTQVALGLLFVTGNL